MERFAAGVFAVLGTAMLSLCATTAAIAQTGGGGSSPNTCEGTLPPCGPPKDCQAHVDCTLENSTGFCGCPGT
jgi:hypothetical protein